MSDKFYDDSPYKIQPDTKIILGGEDQYNSDNSSFSSRYSSNQNNINSNFILNKYRDNKFNLRKKGSKKRFESNLDNTATNMDVTNPENYDKVILDNNGKRSVNEKCNLIPNFRKPRKPLNEHPLNTVYNEDMADLLSKGLMLGGVTVVAKGITDALGPKSAPIMAGATLVGAGALIYKLTDQDIKKYYRNYIMRLEGNYDNMISFNDYKQFVKKYSFKYEEDYYMLNDILAGKEDPIDFNKFAEINRFNYANRAIGRI